LSDTYRHRKGGGKIYGTDADASPDSYLDLKTAIEGNSHVVGSVLVGTQAFDLFAVNSRFDGSVLAASRVVNSTLLDCRVKDSEIVQAWVNDSQLSSCIVRPIQSERPTINTVALRNVLVEGDSDLRGPWTLDGLARIHRGVWEQAPRFMEVKGENGVHVGVTECTEGYAHIACRCKPVKAWLEAGPRLGRILGWTGEQIKQVCRTFELWRDVPRGA
jgi:hypothetical protein